MRKSLHNPVFIITESLGKHLIDSGDTCPVLDFSINLTSPEKHIRCVLD